MKKMLACCGLVCTDCGAMLATLNDDDALRRKTAEEWAQFGAVVKPEDINCEGCLSTGGRVFSYVNVCPIRACCNEKGLANCAPCDDYPCKDLAQVHEHSADAKARLDALRAAPG